ncbi:MAG: LCP family protein [Anaerolineaceae bacterium]|nr:LCP family protein [Anaerolineaceae bacterium]
MEQNQYRNQAGMPNPNAQPPANGPMPYGGMPYPQQNMPQGTPYPQQNVPQSTPYPNQGGYPPRGNMNMPQMQPQQPQMPPAQKPPQTQKSKKKAEKKALNKKKWVTLGIFGIIGLVLGFLAFSLVNRYAKRISMIDLPGAPIVASNSSSTTTDADGDGVVDVNEGIDSLDIAQQTVQKGQAWDGKNRITCLAMGLDYRDWVQNDGTPRSDSMMLLTYDPATQYAGMLSIPRDLWVAIPDHGYGRINTAYSMGEGEHLPGVNGKPGGGPGLAMRTVELFLGVEIQYYAVIDFYGFIEFIDAIDKLAINVRDDITVDPLGAGNTVRLMAGVQDLDGATALAYARYRYTNGGDFERAQRQQDVIMALFEQMKWQLPELLATKSDQLFAIIQRAVKTNLTISDIVKLAWTAVDLDVWYIQRAVIAPPEQVLYDTSVDGQQILVPIPDRIREARDTIFATETGAGATNTDAYYTKEDRLRDEAASVTIINGSTVPGIAERTAEYLQQFGIKVASIAQGTTGYANSLEIRNAKPYAAQFLKEVMSIPTSAVTMNFTPGTDVDLVVTITDAWANSNPM